MQKRNKQNKSSYEAAPPRREETTGETWNELPRKSPRTAGTAEGDRETVEASLRNQEKKEKQFGRSRK